MPSGKVKVPVPWGNCLPAMRYRRVVPPWIGPAVIGLPVAASKPTVWIAGGSLALADRPGARLGLGPASPGRPRRSGRLAEGRQDLIEEELNVGGLGEGGEDEHEVPEAQVGERVEVVDERGRLAGEGGIGAHRLDGLGQPLRL